MYTLAPAAPDLSKLLRLRNRIADRLTYLVLSEMHRHALVRTAKCDPSSPFSIFLFSFATHMATYLLGYLGK